MMDSPIELEKQIAALAQQSGPLIDQYLDYAKTYKDLWDSWASALIDQEFPGISRPRWRLAAVIPTTHPIPRIKQAIENIKTELTPTQIIHDRHTGKIYVWVDEPTPPGQS